MDETMRPRDIQARIRAGASVDDVIVESGLDRERVERFAAPMLAEREHIIYLALDTELRRDFANDISLVAAVSERLTPGVAKTVAGLLKPTLLSVVNNALVTGPLIPRLRH